MKRSITPAELANLVIRAQFLRASGESQIGAVRSACIDAGISTDWGVPLHALINDSPASAEAWAQRILAEALARNAERIEG